MKKGRHRRYEEARMAKRAFVKPVVRCVECGGDSLRGHADWCMAATEEEELLAEGEFYTDEYDDFEADQCVEDRDGQVGQTLQPFSSRSAAAIRLTASSTAAASPAGMAMGPK